MSDTEYTPTDDQLRMAWITQRWNQAGQIRSEGSDDEFDRWLAVHDAELTKRVRAERRETDAQIVEGLGSRLDQRSLSYDDAAWLSGLEDAAAAIRKASDD